jgi:predicted dithiol-disulfide oxidoreductase (DUF899 family)
MPAPKIVSRAEWLQAHRAHLRKEKDLTHLRDRLSAERRELPWLAVDKPYRFDTTAGPKTLVELFGPASQLIVYHFMFAPGSTHRCVGCSFLADHIDAANQHLKHHDVAVVVVSRAPLSELLPFRRRMGWQFSWVSSHGSDFNYDFQVSFTDEQIAAGTAFYNFDQRVAQSHDLPGASVFYREGNEVFHTFAIRARGGESLIGTYSFLDFTPKGRNERGPRGNLTDWVRLHDKYDSTSIAGLSADADWGG